MANDINLDSYFSETIIDNNGVSVCDMNKGIDNLFAYFNDTYQTFEEVQRYLVPEQDEGYPDIIAKKSILGSQQYWWWILMLNRQDDAFEGLKANWVYSINSQDQINTFIENSTDANEASNDDRIGSVIELN